MTSLTRSADCRVAASRCLRWRRMFRYPSAAKITTMVLTRSTISLVLTLRLRRIQRPSAPPRSSIASMTECSLRLHYLNFCGGVLLFLRKDRQVLHGQAEQRESGGDDRAGDRDLGPAGDIMQPRRRFHARDADVQTIG